MPQRNLAVELLRRLLSGEITSRSRKNLVQARSFAEMLERAIRRYQNRAIETAQVIEELIALAKDMQEASARSESLGLSEEELALYDALEINDRAVKVLCNETLRDIARELVTTVRNNVDIDWIVRENVRAKLLVRRILRKHGYPPISKKKLHLTILQELTRLETEEERDKAIAGMLNLLEDIMERLSLPSAAPQNLALERIDHAYLWRIPYFQ